MGRELKNIFEDSNALVDKMKAEGYIINERLSIALYLALAKEKPLFLEGEFGSSFIFYFASI